MDVTIVLLRVVHVLCGVFWAGALMFVVTFLEPSIRASGPEGAKVMRALIQRKYLNVIPILATLTVLSGLWLMWIVSSGFKGAWFASGPGATFTLGSVAGVVALMIGVHVLRPAVLRIGPLAQAAAEAPAGADKDAKMAQVQVLRARAMRSGRWVAVLLAFAVVAMAIARYA
jgi:hypothetical protein